MNEEIRKFANDLGLVIASVWDGYSRKWIVSERDGYFPIFTTSDYDTLIEGLKNGGVFRPYNGGCITQTCRLAKMAIASVNPYSVRT